MQTTITVEVKCDCKIPFRSEIESRLEQILSNPKADDANLSDLPHITDINTVIQNRIIFVKISNPITTRSRILDIVKMLFNKELIGAIKGAKNEITLILV